MSVLAAKVSAHYRTEIVLYATIATAAVVFVCILLACSSFDFTSWMLYVVVIATAFSVVAMIVLVTMMITGSVMKPLLIVILIVGTVIEVVMMIIELQMILGGRSIELSEDDYALGAFMMYTSIMSLFLKLVQLIGFADD
ncbi:uncharacterized protein [Epargyreus clarus]|uniref:uncharacterized protein n=1 Tax=Epargyreus clarus TaxID=520877 RepID=UPI003C30DA28